MLALQGIDELLRTLDLVNTHYNPRLELAGVIVNRVQRTVEHREGISEIDSYFGRDLVWSPHIAKRTVLQEGARRGVSPDELRTGAARDVGHAFEQLANRVEISSAVA